MCLKLVKRCRVFLKVGRLAMQGGTGGGKADNEMANFGVSRDFRWPLWWGWGNVTPYISHNDDTIR
jgi:hypothetical protein